MRKPSVACVPLLPALIALEGGQTNHAPHGSATRLIVTWERPTRLRNALAMFTRLTPLDTTTS